MSDFSPSAFAAAVALAGVVIVAAAAFSGAIDRFRLPAVAFFLALGTAIGPFGLGVADFPLQSPALGAVATLSLVLVLFTDAVTLDMGEVKRHAKLATLILGPATLVTTAVIAGAGYWILGLSPAAAAIVGSALSSTDPVMMRPALRSPAMPATARYALGVESGLNDVVLLPIILVASVLLMHGGMTGHAHATVLTDVLVKGPLVGVIVAFLAVQVLSFVRRRHGMRRDYESIYVLGVAFTAFAVAELVHGSGYMAAFTAGVAVAALDVELCDCFHDYGEATAEMLLLFAFVAFGASLIWTGLDVVSWRSMGFVAIALLARTAVLALTLLPARIDGHSRRLIIWFGPRALSSLLLVMVAVFAGVPAGDELFAITALVVLASIALHGAMLAAMSPRLVVPPPPAATSRPDREEPDVRVTLDEVRSRIERGETVRMLDARSDGAWNAAATKARGAVRVNPADPAVSAAALALPRNDWLVAYCA